MSQASPQTWIVTTRLNVYSFLLKSKKILCSLCWCPLVDDLPLGIESLQKPKRRINKKFPKKQQKIKICWVNSSFKFQACPAQRSSPATCRWREDPAGGRAHCQSTPEDRTAPNSSQRIVKLIKEIPSLFAQHLYLMLKKLRTWPRIWMMGRSL